MTCPPLSLYQNLPPSNTATWSDNTSLALQIVRKWLEVTQGQVFENCNGELQGFMKSAFAIYFYADQVTSLQLSVKILILTCFSDTLTEKVAKPFKIPDTLLSGIIDCKWPGRNQIIQRDKVSHSNSLKIVNGL